MLINTNIMSESEEKKETIVNGINQEFREELIKSYTDYVEKIQPLNQDMRESCTFTPIDNKTYYIYNDGEIEKEFNDEKELQLFLDERSLTS